MKIKNSETIEIQPDGIRQILAAHVSDAQKVEATADRVTFQVGQRTEGYGMAETDVTVFNSATVNVTGAVETNDVLQVLGKRSYAFDADETKQAIADYVGTARGRDVAPSRVELRLTPRHQGDRGGYEGPCLEKAVVTVEID